MYTLIAGALAAILYSGALFWMGVSYEKNNGEIATLTARVATLQQDNEIGRKLLIEEGIISEDIAAGDVKMAEVIDAYKAKLAARGPDAVCALSDDDVNSLRRRP